MKRLIYLLIPVFMAAACGDAPELKEEETPVEKTVKEETANVADVPEGAPETDAEDPAGVTPEMMVAFKRFREAMLNRDAVRLGSMIEGELTDQCAFGEKGTLEPGGGHCFTRCFAA